MKRLAGCFLVLSTISSLLVVNSSLAAEKKSVNQQLLDLLKQKKIVSEQQYREWNQQLKEEESERLSLKYNRGLRLEPRGGKFSLKINGRMENDFTFLEHGHPDDGGFKVRRAWLTIIGRGYKYFGFKLQPDFTGSSRFQDASVDITYSPQLKFRIGQFKTPFSLDWTIASKYRDFMFRALPVFNLSPGRDRGALVQGELAEGQLFYALGVMNGSRLDQRDADKHRDVVARLVFSPFQDTNQPALRGLHFGGSLTYGNQNLNMANDSSSWWSQGRLQNPASGTTFFRFANGVSQDGDRGRYGLEAIWMYGPLSLSGEWIKVQMDNLSVGSQQGDFGISGYYLALSYFLTGEEQTFKNGMTAPITPKSSFDPDKDTWGAWQLVARYGQVDIDEDLLSKGYADASRYTKGAASYTLGLVWYPAPVIRIMLNYIHTKFDNSILLLTRFQFMF